MTEKTLSTSQMDGIMATPNTPSAEPGVICQIGGSSFSYLHQIITKDSSPFMQTICVIDNMLELGKHALDYIFEI